MFEYKNNQQKKGSTPFTTQKKVNAQKHNDFLLRDFPAFSPPTLKFMSEAGNSIQKSESKNNQLPGNLKSGIENLSGFSMDDVNVHYNSERPAQIKAHAFAQGTDIHIAPGQEKHLPHEAWHIAQQKQGRVKPTTQMKGSAINDASFLEKEAEVMGTKALSQQRRNSSSAHKKGFSSSHTVSQRVPYENLEKNDDAQPYKEFGKQIVGTYRWIGKITEELQKGKNSEGLKSIAIGLAEAAISCTVMITPIPSPVGLDIGSGGIDIATNLTAESLGEKGASTVGNQVLGALEPGNIPGLSQTIRGTKTAGVLKNKLAEKFGSVKAAAHTIIKLVPFISQAELIGKGGMKLAQNRDEFNKIKGSLILSVGIVLAELKDAILLLNELESFDDIGITTANSKIPTRHKTRSLKQVIDKFSEKVVNFQKIARDFSEKHEDTTPLLSADNNSLESDSLF